MAFTVQDFQDLLRLLEQHPEWRAELRRLVLTEELLSLPALVRELVAAQGSAETRLARLETAVAALVEAQQRTEERLAELAEAQRRTDERLTRVEERIDRLEAAVSALAEAQRRTDERLGRVEEQVAALIEAQRLTEVRLAELAEAQRRTDERLAELAEAQRRTDERLAELAEAQRRTDERIAELVEAQRRTDERLAELAEAQRHTEERLARLEEVVQALIRRVDRIDIQVAELRGDNLERRYREHVGAYFGPWLRRVRALSDYDLGSLLEDAEDRGRLNVQEAVDVRAADLVVYGRRRTDGQELYLVVEVSASIRREDIERAVRRAGLLGRALGTPEAVIAAAAGEYIDPDARSLALEQGVWLLFDGRERVPGG
jgi:hypothetical protein